MNFKDFGIREWLVIVFIVLGLAAFAFENIFKPKRENSLKKGVFVLFIVFYGVISTTLFILSCDMVWSFVYYFRRIIVSV